MYYLRINLKNTSSGGHSLEEPEHSSRSSQGPSLGRQTMILVLNVQVVLQHDPPSHCSPGSIILLPHSAFRVVNETDGPALEINEYIN